MITEKSGVHRVDLEFDVGIHKRNDRAPVMRGMLLQKELVVGAPKRCCGGACNFCLENARWEQIFNEKLADHDYYRDRSPGIGSPLGKL